MIRKLFGETEEEQFEYLKPRFIALGVGIVILLIGALCSVMGLEIAEIFFVLGEAICVIDLLVFGWAIMKGLFGFATVGILFSRNVVFGAVIFTVYILIGYLGGLIVAVVGFCRLLVLLKKKKENKDGIL